MAVTSIHDLADQAAWEMEGVRLAVARYRAAAAVADPMTLSPGKALVRSVVAPLAAAILAKREEVADQLAAPGRQPEWAWPIQAIDPAKAAVITLNAAVRGVFSRGDVTGGTAAAIVPLSKSIAGALRDELEYERWTEAEQARNAAAKREGVEGHQDRLKALRLRYPALDRRVWARWRVKMDLARDAAWDERAAVGLGAMFIRLLCDVAPNRFVLGERKVADGVQYVLQTTPEVREVLSDLRERSEVSRPRLMPMVCPPVPWAYREA